MVIKVDAVTATISFECRDGHSWSGAEGNLSLELNFKHIDDFEPDKVAAQVAPLKELLDMRLRLGQLLTKLEGNDKLEQMLTGILGDTEKAMALAKELGVEAKKEGE